ncbi:MAG: hypothetical protein COB41_05600 [Proteobacteria bacterium]|nr:MAG: hypothetical protein COB41_05600 [Pseudomonadota bacterium]
MGKKAELLLSDDNITDVYDTFQNEPADSSTDADIKTDAFLNALKEDPEAFVNVSRQLTDGKSAMEFVARYPADKYDYGQLQEHLKISYGGGDYRLLLYSNGKIKANKLISIACQLSEASTGNTALMQTVLDAIQKQNTQIMHLMSERHRVESPPSEGDFLARMVQYKALFSSDGQSGNGLEQLTQSMDVLKSLGINVGGVQAEKESGFSELLEKATPLITAAIQQPNVQPEIQDNNIKKKPNMKMQNGINILINAAKKNADPEVYAALIIDQINNDILINMLLSDDVLKKLINFNRGVSAHMQWFDTLIIHVKNLLNMHNEEPLKDDANTDITPLTNTKDSDETDI